MADRGFPTEKWHLDRSSGLTCWFLVTRSYRSDSDLGGLVPWTQETRMRNAEEATMLAYVFALKWTATFSNLL